MSFVYVLRSVRTGRTYVGFSAHPRYRLEQHNEGVTKSTKGRGPWELVYEDGLATRPEAMRRERYFKTGKGREELRRILGLRERTHG